MAIGYVYVLTFFTARCVTPMVWALCAACRLPY